MKTDEELAAEAQGLDESDDGLDDFNMDIGEVKQGNFEDIVANTQTKWAETEIEAKARVAEELHLSAESVREREAAGEKSDEARLHAAQQKFEATAALNESLLSSSYYNLIQPKYSEKPPQRQYNTPAFFPQVQHPSLSNPETFKNLTRDTLFFAFYYQQQTYQQYLAARQLKIDSWRYHKKENTWFQRAHKPTKTDDDYEIGTYYYFDYLQDWQCKNRNRRSTYAEELWNIKYLPSFTWEDLQEEVILKKQYLRREVTRIQKEGLKVAEDYRKVAASHPSKHSRKPAATGHGKREGGVKRFSEAPDSSAPAAKRRNVVMV
eukprot:gene19891-30589_t